MNNFEGRVHSLVAEKIKSNDEITARMETLKCKHPGVSSLLTPDEAAEQIMFNLV